MSRKYGKIEQIMLTFLDAFGDKLKFLQNELFASVK